MIKQFYLKQFNLALVNKVKFIQELLFNTNNSIKHQSFVYTQLNDQFLFNNSIQHKSFFAQFAYQRVLFNPWIEANEVPPLRAQVYLGTMAIKEYSAFPNAPALLEYHHQIVQCHIQDTRWRFFFTPLQRCCHSFLLPQLTVDTNHHHHLVMPSAQISLTLSRHSSLSFIASGRSSGLHPVSSQSCCMQVRAGRPAFARPCEGVHWSTSLMSSSLLLQQCPACLVCLTLIVYVMGGRWPYSCCFVGAASRTCSILLAAFLCSCRQAFSPAVQLAYMQCIHIAVSTRSPLGRNCVDARLRL